jgi:hypothetical protein
MNGFTRRAEMEAAKYWIDQERDKIKDKAKPPQLHDSKGNPIPIMPLSEDLFYNELEKIHFERLEEKDNEKRMD